jgi:predicted ribosomally synthesized peptide with SipW-like signal peptide
VKIIRKTKVLIAMLTIAAVFMGVAYAAWTDQLVVNGTVATGEVNVQFVEDVLVVPITNPPGLLSGSSMISADGKQVSFTMENLYPGHPAFRLHTEKENMGSIPVRFDSAVLTFDDPDNPALDYLEAWLDVSYREYPGSITWGVTDITEEWFPLIELEDKINNSAQLKSAVFETGGWISLGTLDENGEPQCLRIRLRGDAPNETQGQTVIFTLDLVFRQWNI